VAQGRKWSAWLREGDKVSFEARAVPYIEGDFGHRVGVDVPPARDWRLERPTKVVNHGPFAAPPDSEA
jgi:hypothetical protein